MPNEIPPDVLIAILKLAGVTIVTYYTVSWLIKQIDPINNKQKKAAKLKAEQNLSKIGKNNLKLSEYELLIASQLITPEEISVTWKDIAGLEDVLDEIKETIIFPIKKRHLLKKSKLARPPKGVLLHGPPGCGKTLIAKATAKEAATTFINLDISMLTDKWYGESQKLVTALFSLAEKIQPCIIFIDEIDSLLRTRSSQDHEATAMMKAQFMFLWDGLGTDSDKIVIVMGATNRPQDLDAAILRRMPASFRIPMPNSIQRESILRLILEEEQIDGYIDFKKFAEKTVRFSGSDLRELCRIASLYRVRDYARKIKEISIADNNESEPILRNITSYDLEEALRSMGSSKIDFTTQMSEIRFD